MRDYAKNSSRKTSYKKPKKGFSWFSSILIGVVLIIVGIVIYRMVTHHLQMKELTQAISIEKREPIQSKKPSVNQAPEKLKEEISKREKFDFYRMLPTMQVRVMEIVPASLPTPSSPKLPINTQTPASSTLTPAMASKNGYILQIAAFRNKEDANELKKQIEQTYHLKLTITTIVVNGTSWHRIQTQPFNELNAAKQAQQSLQQNKTLNSIIRQAQ